MMLGALKKFYLWNICEFGEPYFFKMCMSILPGQNVWGVIKTFHISIKARAPHPPPPSSLT
jgi:hypothetical protein